MNSSMVHEAVVFLLATVIVVPLLKRLGMGAVLGYLIAGVMLKTFCIFLNSALRSCCLSSDWSYGLRAYGNYAIRYSAWAAPKSR